MTKKVRAEVSAAWEAYKANPAKSDRKVYAATTGIALAAIAAILLTHFVGGGMSSGAIGGCSAATAGVVLGSLGHHAYRKHKAKAAGGGGDDPAPATAGQDSI